MQDITIVESPSATVEQGSRMGPCRLCHEGSDPFKQVDVLQSRQKVLLRRLGSDFEVSKQERQRVVRIRVSIQRSLLNGKSARTEKSP